MYRNSQINVFLFTGFLEAGKTSFIQQSLENINFCTGEPTLLLVCEEGIEDYNPERFANGGVTLRKITKPEELNRAHLLVLQEEANATRILIEYNGMWMLEDLYKALPDNWTVLREMLFIDGKTFFTYNTNMRQLMYDKLKGCTVAVFNDPPGDMDRVLVHKIVRGASRRADIAYQYYDGRVEYDQTVDTEPFDLFAPVVNIGEDDFAIWSRDITDEPEKYNGKTLKLKGRTVLREDMAAGEMGFGRYVMVCCENDIQFVGFMCEGVNIDVSSNEWLELTGTIRMKYHKVYGKRGPVFQFESAQRCSAPEQTVATFY